MKKIAMVLACFALVSMTATAQLAQITLMHDGNATMFNANQTGAALDAAVDGDVLYFTAGSYEVPVGGLIIKKKVSLVGVGVESKINGNITIDLANDDVAMPAHLLDALQINGSIKLGNQPINGLNIRKCMFNGLTNPTATGAKQTNFVIDRCFINGTLPLSNYTTESLTVINSKIKYLYGKAITASSATIINCNIYDVDNSGYSNMLLATVINSVIGGASSSLDSRYDNDCVFMNCICTNSYEAKGLFEHGTSTNCKVVSSLKVDAATIECTNSSGGPTEDKFLNLGYLGTDGTVVGITGGAAPFTLVPAAPRITESVIKVDPETKKLNVNLKVTAN